MEEQWLTIKNKIETLDKNYQIEILKIFLKHNIEMTENNNGTFINLTYIKKKRVFNEIVKYLKYIQLQEKTLSETEDLKQDMAKLLTN